MTEAGQKATVSKAKVQKKANLSRKTLKDCYRSKLKKKLLEDPEFKKSYFEGKSKRSEEKKVKFKTRHQKA